jgi:hypothetical protein
MGLLSCILSDLASWLKKYWWMLALFLWLILQREVEALRSNYLLDLLVFLAFLLGLMLIQRMILKKAAREN